MRRKYALRDDQWERIKDMLPGQAGRVGVTARDNRLFVEAVLFRYRSGIVWRDLPERFGDFRVVHLRYMRWSRSGVWQRVFKMLGQDATNKYAVLDAAMLRAQQSSLGDLSTKIPVLAETSGQSAALSCQSAPAQGLEALGIGVSPATTPEPIVACKKAHDVRTRRSGRSARQESALPRLHAA